MITRDATLKYRNLLGHYKENNAVRLRFDLTKFEKDFPGGKVRCFAQRHGETSRYPVELTVDGNSAYWTVTESDVSIPGNGRCELEWLVDDTVVKSEIYGTMVLDSLKDGPEPPDAAGKAWYEKIEAEIGNLDDLKTEAKDDLVSAINEAAQAELPPIDESTKDMALYNDGEKAEWREQRNPIPDYQENDPESPNYIRNRNGGYYTWDEENPIGYYLVINGEIYNNRFCLPNGFFTSTTMLYIAIKRGDTLSAFFKPRAYFEAEENASELGFYLSNYNDLIKECTVNYIPSPTDITDIKMYAVEPHTWPSDFIPIAAYKTPGSVGISSQTKTNEYGNNAIRYFSDSHTNEDGTLYTEKYFINIDDFEWSESSGAPDFHYQTVERGWILKSSNYLVGVLGLGSADFPIRIISTNTVYGSGIPYLNCQFFTKTGKSGYFNWRANGKAENAVLNQETFKYIKEYTGNFPYDFENGHGCIIAKSDYLVTFGFTTDDFPVTMLQTKKITDIANPEFYARFVTYKGRTGLIIFKASGFVNSVQFDPSSDSDIFVVRFTQNDNTWSADKTYAEIKQAIDDGKVVQGVVYNNFIGIGILHGERVIFQFNASSFDPDSGIYGLKALVIIVKADGITVHDSWDGPWGEYHDAILPSQVLLVTNAGGNISAKLSALDKRRSPLTYLISYNPLNTFPVLTALYLAPNVAPERFYFSNVVTTPDSATSSAKADFVFKSADATKTLTGSVTKPNDWDGETPLAETWTYIEADPLDGAVRYDKTQSLTDAQKQQARDNIGAASQNNGIARVQYYAGMRDALAIYSAAIIENSYDSADPPAENIREELSKLHYPLLAVRGKIVGMGDSSVTIYDAGGNTYYASLSFATGGSDRFPQRISYSVPAPTAENVGMVPVAAVVNETGPVYGYKMKELVTGDGKGLILNSSTADSAKRFKITADDSGTLTATEIVEVPT